tara:strand:- start:2954 stop:4963 length:2010 start_codon:yes stop_codon:yes gene_type:complete
MLTPVLNIIFTLIWFFLCTWFHGFVDTIIILFFLSFCQLIFLDNGYNDHFETAGLILVFLLGLSWLLSGNNYLIFFISIVFISINFQKSSNIYKVDLKALKSSFLLHPNNSVLMLILILITTNSIALEDKTYVYDSMHPSYEHTLGNSFSRSIFNSPDLSFQGKNIQWHFLSTQLSRLVRLIGFDFFKSVYLITPSILFILIYHLFTYFLREGSKFHFSAIFLFLPIGDESILSRFILSFSPSFSVGLLLLIISYHYLKHKKYMTYFFYSSLLMLTKGSFYPVLMGYIFLKYLFTSSKNKKTYIYIFFAKILIFSFTYIIFYNNAHSYNHWYLIGFLYDFLTTNNIISVLLFLIALLFIFFNYFNKKNTLLNSDLIVLSGLLGSLLVFESAEENHAQFLIAAYPFIILSILKRNIFENKFILFIWFFLFFNNNQPFKTSMFNFFQKLNYTGLTEIYFKSVNLGFSYNNETKELYSKLNKLTDKDNSLIWFPTFYEKDSGLYWPKDGFLRSAIADRQFYIENMKYKGIIMEPDFSRRVANSFFWYKQFVQPSDENKKKYNRTLFLIENYNSKINNFKIKNNSKRKKILSFLGFEKKISWNNIREIRLKELNSYLKEDLYIKLDNKITHIILENGDTLVKNSVLKENFKLVFNNNTGQIWERAIHHNNLYQ